MSSEFWATLAAIVAVLVVTNAGWLFGFKFILNRSLKGVDSAVKELTSQHRALEKEVTKIDKMQIELRAEMRSEYISRGEWIRLTTRYENRIDGVHAALDEIRDEIRKLTPTGDVPNGP